MYKKTILKITLLLSNASTYATQARRVVGHTAKTIGTIVRHYHHSSKVHIQKFIQAIKNQEIEIAKELLQRDYNLIHTSFDGHSLAHTALLTNNSELIELVHNYGAQLFDQEKKENAQWQEEYPLFFISFDPNFAPY